MHQRYVHAATYRRQGRPRRGNLLQIGCTELCLTDVFFFCLGGSYLARARCIGHRDDQARIHSFAPRCQVRQHESGQVAFTKGRTRRLAGQSE